MVFFRQGDSSIYNFSQVWVMVFHYDRISLKEGIGLETYEHCDEFIGESLSKRCDSYRLLLYIKNNLTTNKEFVIIVTTFYGILNSNLEI